MGFKPLSVRGESYASMDFEEMASQYNQNQNILWGVDGSNSNADTKFWLTEAAKDGILFYRDGRAVAEVEVENEVDKIWEGYENRTSDPFLSDLVIVGYNPLSNGQRFEYFPIVLDDKIRANWRNPLTEEQLDQKYKEAAEPRKEEPRNIPREGGLFDDDPFAGYDPFGQNPAPAEKEETAPVVEEKKDDFDPNYGPSGFNGKEFNDMTRAEQRAYNKDVAAIVEDLAKEHTVDDAHLHEVLLDACKHGMLYYPNGNVVTEETLEATYEGISHETDPDKAADVLTDFVVVEYNPVTDDITQRTIRADNHSVHMDMDHPLTELEDVYKEKENYEKKLADRAAAEKEAESVAPAEEPVVPVEEAESVVPVQEVNAPAEEPVVPVEQANEPVEEPVVPVEQANAPVQEANAPVEEANAPVEKNEAKPFAFTRPDMVEDKNGSIAEKTFDNMDLAEKRLFSNRNETVLRGLDESQNAEDMSLWLNDAAKRGILFYRDGRAVELNEVNNEIAKLSGENGAIASGSFLSDLVVANYVPQSDSFGFHPISVANGKIIANSTHPLSREELERNIAGKLLKLGPTGFNGKPFAEMNADDKQEYTDKVNEVVGFLEKKDQRLGNDFHARLQAAAALGMLSDPFGHMVTVEEVEKFSKSPEAVKDLIVTITAPNGESKESYTLDVNTQGLTPTVTLDRKMHRLTDEKVLDPMCAGMINRLSPKELVEELAASVQELNSAKSNAITDKLKKLKLYADLGYTTKDGVRHEKGCIKVGDDVYLRGETTPVTPEKFTRFIEGVQPPKKPSGFFSGVREWWHNHVSKLDDFTKYEEQMREYEITKYYTCVKAGIPVEKTDAVKAYEKEAAVQLFIGAHFRDLENEWVKKLTTDSDFDKTLDSDELKEEMLKSTELQAFIDNPATQKYLRQYYGENFVIFGRGGRKLGGVNAETKAQFIAAGERVCEGCKWGILSENADTAAETDLYAVMDRIAKSDVQAAHDAAFMENLETVLRKDTPVSKQILNKLSEMSSEELADFRYTCSVLNKNDEPFSVELTAADKGLLSKAEEDTVINEQSAHWLKPLEALAAGATEDEKAFVDAFKQAFADHPYLARDVMHELGTIDEKFLETMAPAVEQYAQIKDYDCMKKTYGVGVLEVIAHNGLFFGDNASRNIFERIEYADVPIHSHEEFWARVEIEEWSQDFNKFAHEGKTFAFVADFRAAVLSHPDIGAKIMNEHKTIDQNFMNTFTSAMNSYSKSEKLGKLGVLAAVGKTGLFTEETNKAIDKACKAVDPSYVSSFVSEKAEQPKVDAGAAKGQIGKPHRDQHFEKKPAAVSVEEGRANAQRIRDNDMEALIDNLQNAYDVPREVIEAGLNAIAENEISAETGNNIDETVNNNPQMGTGV